jgi:hypothetical protein
VISWNRAYCPAATWSKATKSFSVRASGGFAMLLLSRRAVGILGNFVISGRACFLSTVSDESEDNLPWSAMVCAELLKP